MLTWIGIALGILVMLVVVLAVAAHADRTHRRRRIAAVLRTHDVDFVRIDLRFSYGYPTYIVVLDSIEKMVQFRNSSAFKSLVQEVQKMHGHGNTSFDATRAVYAHADVGASHKPA